MDKQYSQKTNTRLQLEGYGGLEKCKHLIIPHFPKKIKTFIEPFAGLGRITELTIADTYHLNDMSDYAIETLTKKFPTNPAGMMDSWTGQLHRTYTIDQMDFKDFIIKYMHLEDVFIFCDPPWRKNIYKNNDGERMKKAFRSPRKPAFTEHNIAAYYDALLKILPNCKGKWMITSDRAETENGKRLQKSGYVNKTEEAPDGCQRFFGRLPAVRLCANYFKQGDINAKEELA